MAGLPKTDFEKRAVRKQVGRQRAFLFGMARAWGKEMAMERAMPFDEDLGVQYGLEEYPLEDSLDVLGSARVGHSKVRILRLVTTPVEGCELLTRLRSDPQTSDIPVIVLTR
jgi:hypothetical protein